jgi:hypothetical protein
MINRKVTISIIIIQVFLFLGNCQAKIHNIKDILMAWNEAKKIRYSYKFEPLNFDPFQIFFGKLQPKIIINKNAKIYLKDYSLDQVRLVGIVKQGNKIIAVVEDPKKRAVFLKEGDLLGKDGGIISKITKCSLHIEINLYDQISNKLIKKEEKILFLHGDRRCVE